MGILDFGYPFVGKQKCGLFPFLAIMNNAAMNICVQVFFCRDIIFISPGYTPRSAISGS